MIIPATKYHAEERYHGLIFGGDTCCRGYYLLAGIINKRKGCKAGIARWRGLKQESGLSEAIGRQCGFWV
jgi:hypothetical protein